MSTADGKRSNIGRKLIAAIVVLFFAAAAYSFWFVLNKTGGDQENLQSIAGLRVQAISIPQLVARASVGEALAFDKLEELQRAMEIDWGKLRKRLVDQGEVSDGHIQRTAQEWQATNGNLVVLNDNRDSVKFVAGVANNLTSELPDIQRTSSRIVDSLVNGGASAAQVSVAQQMLWRVERIGRNLDRLLLGSNDVAELSAALRSDADQLSQSLSALKQGGLMPGVARVIDADAVDGIERLSATVEGVSASVSRLQNLEAELTAVHQAVEGLADGVPRLMGSLDTLDSSVGALGASGDRFPNNMVATIAMAVGFVLLLVLLLVNRRATARDLEETEKEKNKSQQAILRLLDEISDLADGDLTVKATVTEDLTGVIADSINFAIAELRTLVQNVATSSGRLADSTKETRGTSLRLAESAEHQAQEIAGASAAINEMAITIDQVSSNSSESAAVAERSVSIAKNGAQLVRNTIDGMDTIREQIQDTSKRIKRLGESSQEIGDIVSLINEIADQTNILALNAAIQAAMAGEAGRGFAVVADEVQRLAERSATATKQIASLVKTIQTDTNEAVSSMEQTTAEVVKGADLANSAGIALEEIESVSTHLAELIQDISEAAKHQASTSAHISNTMNVIQEITSQTLAGTNETSRSIGELADMAVQMRESVSGFILPAQEKSGVAESLVSTVEPPPVKRQASVVEEEEVFVEDDPEADLDLPDEPASAAEVSAQASPDDELVELDQFEAEIEAMLKGER